MVEGVLNYKKFVGNVCLHRELVVERKFLRRNLRHILDSHEKELRQNSNARPHEDMIANEKRVCGWNFPTKEMLEDLMKGQKPVLQIETLQIRHPRSKARIQKRISDHARDDDGLEWLPHPDTEFNLPCQVGITVLDTRTSKQRIVVESRSAIITQAHHNSERHPHFDIKLDRPFLIELNNLFVVTDAGTNGYRHWKRTVTAKYVLEITIQCQDSDDTAEFLSRIEDKDSDSYNHAPGNEGILKASWENLPACPSEGDLMTLRRAKGHKSLEPDFKLEVAMGWIRKQESVLARYNKRQTEMRKPSRQLLTPSASDDLDKAMRRYVITYNYRENLITRVFTIEGLFCPICPRDREHSSFEHLVLHCGMYHDHFKFESEDATSEDDPSITRKNVLVCLAEKALEKQITGGTNTQINWVAPRRPFDISAHVRGEDDWIGHRRAKTGTRRGRPLKDRERDYVPSVTPQPIRKRPAPDEVEDLPEQRPKKRQVPNVPDVSFYHSTSKQQMIHGEYVAESEDDIDESWLVQNQGHALEEMGINGAAKDFTRVFNQHLAREQSDSSILTREGLIRFARSRHNDLQDVEWQRQFRAKLNQLRDAGIIGDEIVKYCIRGLQTAPEVRNPVPEKSTPAELESGDEASRVTNGVRRLEDGSRQRRIWKGGKFVSRDSGEAPLQKSALLNGVAHVTNGTSTPYRDGIEDMRANEQSDGLSKMKSTRVCLCGNSAKDTRGGIACADPVSWNA